MTNHDPTPPPPPQPVLSHADAPADDARPTHVRWQVMAFLCVLAFLTYFDRVCIMRAQVDIQRDLGLSDYQLGWVLGAFFLAYALFEIPGGWLGDRFGARGTLTRIVLAWSLFTALSGSATGFLSLLTFRFLFGAGEAGAFPNMARVQSAWLPLRTRGYASGMIWLAARWGGAFSPLIFGTMLRFLGSPDVRGFFDSIGLTALANAPAWRMGFWASGLLGVFWVAAFWPWFRDDPAQKRTVNRAELELIRQGGGGGSAPGHAHVPGVWRMLLTSRGVWAISLLYFFASFGWSFFITWMPRYLKDVHGVSFQKSELVSALPLFLGGLSCLAGGFLSDFVIRRTGRRRLGRAVFPVTGYTVAAAAMLTIPFVRSAGEATVCMCVAAFFFDFGQGANWASIVDMGGRYAGTAAGFLNMVGNTAGFVSPVAGAWIFQHLGWSVLFTVYAAMYLLAASMWLFIDPTRRFYDDRPTGGRRGFPVAVAEVGVRADA